MFDETNRREFKSEVKLNNEWKALGWNFKSEEEADKIALKQEHWQEIRISRFSILDGWSVVLERYAW